MIGTIIFFFGGGGGVNCSFNYSAMPLTKEWHNNILLE